MNSDTVAKTITCLECRSHNVEEVVEENRRYYFCQSCNKLHERAIDSRFGKDITLATPNGPLHFSVGAYIRNQNNILFIKRRSYPYGYSFPAGHMEYNEAPIEAVKREVLEELGLRINKTKLLFEGVINGNKCRYGVDIHMWHFFECVVEDTTPIVNSEIESIAWKTFEESSDLNLVPVARYLIKNVIRKLPP